MTERKWRENEKLEISRQWTEIQNGSELASLQNSGSPHRRFVQGSETGEQSRQTFLFSRAKQKKTKRQSTQTRVWKCFHGSSNSVAALGMLRRCLPFTRKCSVREQLLKQRKRTTYLAAFLWNPEKHANKILLGVACSFSTRSFTHKQQLLNTNLLNAHCCCKTWGNHSTRKTAV